MSKFGQKYVFLLFIGLLSLVPFLVGCNGCAPEPVKPKPVITDSEPAKPVEPVVEPPVIEIPVVEPPVVEPAPVVEPPVVEPAPVVKPPVIEVPIVETPPDPVIEEKTEEPKEGVQTDAPVDTTPPVDQTPPINTKSPVNQTSPVVGKNLIPALLRWIPIAILVLQEDGIDNKDALPVPAQPQPGQPVPPQPISPQPGQPQVQPGVQPVPGEPSGEGRGQFGPPGGMQGPGRGEFNQQGGRGEFNQPGGRGEFQRPGGNAPGSGMPGSTGRGGPQTGGLQQGMAPRPQVELAPSRVITVPNQTPVEYMIISCRYSPWKDVIEWFANEAALNLQADKMPTGTFNYQSDPTKYSPTDVLDILNGYLQFKDYTLIRKGRTLFVIYLPEGVPQNLLEPITAEELDTRGKYEICKCVFDLNQTPPDIIQTEIERLLGPQGVILQMPRSQQIAITDTGGTLRTIRNIIQRIDDPEGFNSLQIVELKNTTAETALQMLRTLLTDTNDTTLRTAAEPLGKKVFLSGRVDILTRATEALKRIDDSFASDDPERQGELQFEPYEVGFADPATVFSVLQTLLAGIPEVRLSLDPRTNGIMVRARPATHATVREAIKQMQIGTPQVDIIPLKRMSPVTAVETIKTYFQTAAPASTTTTTGSRDGRQQTTTPATQPPTVEPDKMARQIIVKGTLSQIQEIRGFLAKLGEDGVPTPPSSIATVRPIPLSPAAAALVMKQLQTVVPTLDPSIKVNLPAPPPAPIPEPAVETIDDNVDELERLIDETLEKLNSEPRELPMTRLQRLAADPVLAQVAPTATPAAQSEVNVVPTAGGIVLTSNDPEALAKIEELIRMLSDPAVMDTPELKEYYLKHATAAVVSNELQTLMGTSSGLGASGISSVNLPEWQHAEMMAFVGQGNSIEKTGTVSVLVNERLNGLLVTANPVDHMTIEKLLTILDQADRVDNTRIPVPRIIELKNMSANDARASVERVFSNRMQQQNRGGQQGQQQQGRGQQPQMMIPGMEGGPQLPPGLQQAIQGMMQGGGRGGAGSTPREQEPPMSLDVMPPNSLVVSSTESTFKAVEQYVQELDRIAGEQTKVIAPIQLVHTTPAFAQQSLMNALGSAVQFSQNRGAAQQGMGGGNLGGGNFGGGNFGGGNFGGMNLMGGGQRPGGNTFGGGMTTPFANTMGGARPGGTIGGGTMGAGTIGGARPGGTIGGGTIGGGTMGGARPGGTIGGGGTFGGGTFGGAR